MPEQSIGERIAARHCRHCGLTNAEVQKEMELGGIGCAHDLRTTGQWIAADTPPSKMAAAIDKAVADARERARIEAWASGFSSVEKTKLAARILELEKALAAKEAEAAALRDVLLLVQPVFEQGYQDAIQAKSVDLAMKCNGLAAVVNTALATTAGADLLARLTTAEAEAARLAAALRTARSQMRMDDGDANELIPPNYEVFRDAVALVDEALAGGTAALDALLEKERRKFLCERHVTADVEDCCLGCLIQERDQLTTRVAELDRILMQVATLLGCSAAAPAAVVGVVGIKLKQIAELEARCERLRDAISKILYRSKTDDEWYVSQQEIDIDRLVRIGLAESPADALAAHDAEVRRKALEEMYALLNRARGLLIDRNIAGTLTNEERAHLLVLNAFVDKHLAAIQAARAKGGSDAR